MPVRPSVKGLSVFTKFFGWVFQNICFHFIEVLMLRGKNDQEMKVSEKMTMKMREERQICIK